MDTIFIDDVVEHFCQPLVVPNLDLCRARATNLSLVLLVDHCQYCPPLTVYYHNTRQCDLESVIFQELNERPGHLVICVEEV